MKSFVQSISDDYLNKNGKIRDWSNVHLDPSEAARLLSYTLDQMQLKEFTLTKEEFDLLAGRLSCVIDAQGKINARIFRDNDIEISLVKQDGNLEFNFKGKNVNYTVISDDGKTVLVDITINGEDEGTDDFVSAASSADTWYAVSESISVLGDNGYETSTVNKKTDPLLSAALDQYYEVKEREALPKKVLVIGIAGISTGGTVIAAYGGSLAAQAALVYTTSCALFDADPLKYATDKISNAVFGEGTGASQISSMLLYSGTSYFAFSKLDQLGATNSSYGLDWSNTYYYNQKYGDLEGIYRSSIGSSTNFYYDDADIQNGALLNKSTIYAGTKGGDAILGSTLYDLYTKGYSILGDGTVYFANGNSLQSAIGWNGKIYGNFDANADSLAASYGLTKSQVLELINTSDNLLTPTQVDILKNIRSAAALDPSGTTTVVKVIPESRISEYLSRGDAAGFVFKEVDFTPTSYNEAYNNLALNYEDSPFKPDTDSIMGIIKMEVENKNIIVPLSSKFGGEKNYPFPYTGNGFTRNNNLTIPEYIVTQRTSFLGEIQILKK
jgi:hypothetical protein